MIQELSRGKTEALKLMDEDMDHRLEELKQEKDIYWEGVLKKRYNNDILIFEKINLIEILF